MNYQYNLKALLGMFASVNYGSIEKRNYLSGPTGNKTNHRGGSDNDSIV